MTFDAQIGAINNFNFAPENQPKTIVKTGNTFDSIFNAAMDVLKETNAYQLSAEQLQTDYATGKTDDMLSVMLAQDKAYNTLNFTVQVTNKIIESYREIMRMQM